MAKIDVYDLQGKKAAKIQLPKEIFEAKINELLMAQAVKVYLSNQRRSYAKTKKRGEVRGSGRKIYRQKGTGRARHSDRYAPIFVGGGVAHGPTGKENYKLKMSKKMRRLALFSALTSKLKEKEVLVVEDLKKMKPKTRKIIKIMKNLKIKMKNSKLKEKILLVLPGNREDIFRSAKNIAMFKVRQANLLNTYEVLNGGRLIFMKSSIKTLKEAFL